MPGSPACVADPSPPLPAPTAAVSMQMPTHTGTPGSGIFPVAATIQALGLSTFQADAPALVLPPIVLPPTASPPTGSTHHTVSPLSPRPTPHNPLAGFLDISAIPQKLLEAILTWQYTDLSEPLPDLTNFAPQPPIHRLSTPTSF